MWKDLEARKNLASLRTERSLHGKSLGKWWGVTRWLRTGLWTVSYLSCTFMTLCHLDPLASLASFGVSFFCKGSKSGMEKPEFRGGPVFSARSCPGRLRWLNQSEDTELLPAPGPGLPVGRGHRRGAHCSGGDKLATATGCGRGGRLLRSKSPI